MSKNDQRSGPATFSIAAHLLALACVLAAASCKGASTPVALASESSPFAIATQAGQVYWLVPAPNGTPAALRAVAGAGGSVRTVGTVNAPRSLALSAADAIIGSGDGNVYSLPLAGGASHVLIPKTIAGAAIAVWVADGFAYALFNAGRIARIALSGGASDAGTGAAEVQEVATASGSNTLFAADSAYVYWGSSTGDLFRAPVDGSGSAQPLGNIAGASPAQPAFLGGKLYFFGAGYLGSIDETSGAIAQLLAGTTAWSLGGNGHALFLGLTHGIGELVPPGSVTSLVIAVGVPGTSLAADESNVYWISDAIDLYGNPTATSTIYRGAL